MKTTRNTYCLVFFISLLCWRNGVAQQIPQLYFENITNERGLSDNIITCFYEDKKGFLWIGTSFGLNRYDGNKFITFYNEEGNPNSLSGNVIVDIIEDKQGVFWIATRDGGLTRYDPSQMRDKQFTQLRNDPGIEGSLFSNRLTALSDLNDDYIMLSSENISVAFVNKTTYAITYHTSSDKSFAFIDPRSGKPKPEGGTWVHQFELENDNLYVTRLSNADFHFFNVNTFQEIILESIEEIATPTKFEIDDTTIWFGSWTPGLFMIQYQKNHAPIQKVRQKKILDLDIEVVSIESFDQHFLLAGSKTSGLFLVNKNNFQYQKFVHDKSNKFSLASNRVNCILKDSKGIIWVGTTAGISKYNPIQWQFNVFALDNNSEKDIIHFATSVLEDNSLALCTSNGIYHFSKESKISSPITFNYRNSNINPTAIIPVANGKKYLTSESGIFWYEPATKKIEPMSPEKNYNAASKIFSSPKSIDKGSYQVYHAIFDTINQHPIQIFATIGWGLGMYDTKENIYYDLCTGPDSTTISNNFVRVIFKDSKGNIWVGTSEGLNKWNESIPINNNFVRYVHTVNDPNSISNNTITGMYEDAKGNIWITTGNGLNKFDGEKFTYYAPPLYLNSPMHGLYADNNNNIWTSVRGGFQVFNLLTEGFRFVPVMDASWLLKNPATILQNSDGYWYYGAGNHLIRFNPDQYVFDTTFPNLYITDFILQDQQLLQTEAFNDLTFKHSDNFITITFSSLQLSQPASVKYQYQLVGLSDNWINLENNGKITFASLPPGAYALFVKVTNPLGDWSTETLLTEFKILKPWWQQWWFFLLSIFGATGIVFIVIRYREQNLLRLQNMRNKIANDLHDDVGSALSTINLYSEVAKMKSNDSDNELNDILNKISNTSIEMQDNMNHIVWSLQPRNDNFEQMMLRMKSHALENLQIKNIKTEFIVDERLIDLKLPHQKRQEFFLIFKEAIHNIVKYANCTEVQIKFTKKNNKLQMEISDNGVGFDLQAKHNGNGLHSMRERSEKLNGELQIISNEGKGTFLHLMFTV